MSDSTDTQPADAADQQVTSKIPTIKPAKNPKRVAAGKLVAERTRLALEAQKKAVSEAAVIIENNKAIKTPVTDNQRRNKKCDRKMAGTQIWVQ